MENFGLVLEDTHRQLEDWACRREHRTWDLLPCEVRAGCRLGNNSLAFETGCLDLLHSQCLSNNFHRYLVVSLWAPMHILDMDPVGTFRHMQVYLQAVPLSNEKPVDKS